MNRRNLLLIPVAIPVLWAFTAPADEVSFHVAEGTTLVSTYDSTVELSLDEMRIVTNGEEQDATMFGLEIDMSNVTSLQFDDEYIHVKGGMPTEFIRTFETVANVVDTSQANAVTGSNDLSVISESELEGIDVRFSWNAEESEYDVAFADEKSDEDPALLEGLSARADLSQLLPAAGVSKGDTWEADTDVIMVLMSPGGDTKQKPVDTDGGVQIKSDPMSELSFSEMMGEIHGEVNCEYMGLVDVEGVEFAQIKVELAIQSANDLSALLQENAGDMGQEGVDIQFDAVDVELIVEGKGTLLWDLRGGHFVSFDFDGDLEQIVDLSMSLETPMGDMEMEQTISMSGTLNFDFSATKE